jgi:hypothetical protein
MFKYLHVKNKMNPWGAAQPTANTPTISLSRFDDNAALRPSPTLWGTARVQARENIREAIVAWVWDLHNTGVQVQWKAHQSADSSAYIRIICCPTLINKDGLTQELVRNLKEVKLKLIRKGFVSSDFMDEPLPTFYILWRQNTQGKGRNKGEKLLSLNNLPLFIQNGCVSALL